MTSPSSVALPLIEKSSLCGGSPDVVDDVSTDNPTSYIRQGDNFMCTICNKIVTSKAAIVRHIQLTHEKRKPYECNICHRKFGYKNILMEHQNVHFGIKPYACNLCDKRFAARSNLFQHRLLHRKPYSCEFCSKRFDRNDQLNRHMMSHPVQNMMSCTMCPFKTMSQDILSQHMKQSHSLQMFDSHKLQNDDSKVSYAEQNLGQNMGLGMLPNMDTTEALKTIDNICSQLASRPQQMELARQMHMALKQEPMSPPQQSSTPRSSQYKSYPRTSLPLPVTEPSVSNGNVMMSQSMFEHSTVGDIPMGNDGDIAGANNQLSYGGPVFPNMMSPPYNKSNSNSGQSFDQNKDLHTSPSPSIGSAFMAETASSRLSSPSVSISRPSSAISNSRPSSAVDPTKSTADSTSNLSEVICGLQSVLQKAQDIPEISIQVTRARSCRDAATQHTSHIVGMPSLQDVLSFYESQGKLYRCPHCKILFEERGMFFLHKSLHGEMSPWECSICHKICSDKNDFNLHFVNEQHSMM